MPAASPRSKRGLPLAYNAAEYRGLRPGSKLVMPHKGRAFELAFKHRQLDGGPVACPACDAL